MSLESVIGAFASQVAELREATLLRVDENAKYLYSQEIQAIESTVRALESKLKDIKEYVKNERRAVSRAQSMIPAAMLQKQQIEHISDHLPTYLPSLPSPDNSPALLVKENQTHPPMLSKTKLPSLSTTAETATKKSNSLPMKAHRRYISNDEFNSVSTYMRGRLTADKVNAALDEIAAHAETNASLVHSIKTKKPVGPLKKQAQWLTTNFATQDVLKGKVWVLESDLKSGAALRLDKTGKTVLTLLRHLGRLQETRISADGATHVVYALC